MGMCRLTEYMGQVSCYICIFLIFIPRCPFLIPVGNMIIGWLSLQLELTQMFSIFVQSRCSSARFRQHCTIKHRLLTYFLMVLHGWGSRREVSVELFLFLAPVLGKSMLQQA